MPRLTAYAVLAGWALTVPAVPAFEEKAPKAEARVAVRLIAQKATYSGIQEKQPIDAALEKAKADRFGQAEFPPAPAVDLVFELRNTSKHEMHCLLGDDDMSFALELEGPGAMSVQAARAFTQEKRRHRIEKVAPGKTLSLPIKRLAYGYRGEAYRAYWTAAGDYTLTATLNIQLGWHDPQEEVISMKSFGLKADAVKLTVQARAKQ
jgi:hypothetical protein